MRVNFDIWQVYAKWWNEDYWNWVAFESNQDIQPGQEDHFQMHRWRWLRKHQTICSFHHWNQNQNQHRAPKTKVHGLKEVELIFDDEKVNNEVTCCEFFTQAWLIVFTWNIILDGSQSQECWVVLGFSDRSEEDLTEDPSWLFSHQSNRYH